MVGWWSRREVRSTACSRNSEANCVWAVSEELPSKAEVSRSVADGVEEPESWPASPAVVVEGE